MELAEPAYRLEPVARTFHGRDIFAPAAAHLAAGVDLVALSFVRRAEDIEFVRKHTRLPLIAKIEKPQAAANAEEIVKAALSGIMVARGDLGIEVPIASVPVLQKRLIALAGRNSKPAITATQMLASMVTSDRPTRAEVTDDGGYERLLAAEWRKRLAAWVVRGEAPAQYTIVPGSTEIGYDIRGNQAIIVARRAIEVDLGRGYRKRYWLTVPIIE